jgi:hypothetical protein
MKKWLKILIIIFVVLMILILAVSWKSILKPYAEPCGFGGVAGVSVSCECSGIKFTELLKGSSGTYCLGTCGECACSNYNFTTKISKEVNCSELKIAIPEN